MGEGMTGLIVIVSRNNRSLTQATVRSALGQDFPDLRVMVVDNASSDGTVEWLQARPDLLRMCFQCQVSLSTAWNAALRWALIDQGLPHVLVCNNDIVLRPDTYSILAGHGGEFVTCVSVDSYDQMGVPGDRAIEDLRPMSRPRPDFSCYLIRQSVPEKVGWFDEEYFPAFLEDNRFHVECHRHGVQCVCIDLPFLHLGSQTIKTADPAEVRRIQRGAERNRQRFRERYGCLPGSKEYEALFSAPAGD